MAIVLERDRALRGDDAAVARHDRHVVALAVGEEHRGAVDSTSAGPDTSSDWTCVEGEDRHPVHRSLHATTFVACLSWRQ